MPTTPGVTRRALAERPASRRPHARGAAGRTKDTRDVCEIQYVDERRVRAAAREMRDAATVGALAQTFKVLGDPNRVRIAWALAHQELCVCDLATLLGMSQSAVSHSLRALRQLGLVTYRKEGPIAYYKLDDEHIAHLLAEGFRHADEHA